MSNKILYSLLVLFLSIYSCSNYENEQELQVIKAVYNSSPKIIPPPPLLNDSIKRKPLEHKYAINENFFNGKYKASISNVFTKRESNKWTDSEVLDSLTWSLARKLIKQESKQDKIDTAKLQELLNKKIVFLTKSKLDRNIEIKKGVNRLLTFSHVEFDDGLTQAAVAVINYGDRLDASSSIYILKKINKKWVVTHHEALLEVT
jgi:hypothetical protein